MVPEPANSAAQSVIAGMSATVLALTGVTFHGLLWALAGAVVALMFARPEPDTVTTRAKVLASIFASMLVGAVMADLIAAILENAELIKPATAHAMHLGLAFVIGAGAKRILNAAIDKVVAALGGGR